MNVTNLDSVTFGVTDLAACRRFWTDFGLIESTAADGATVFACKNGSTVVLRERRRSQAAATDRARRNATRGDFRRQIGRRSYGDRRELERDRPVRVDADGTRARASIRSDSASRSALRNASPSRLRS